MPKPAIKEKLTPEEAAEIVRVLAEYEWLAIRPGPPKKEKLEPIIDWVYRKMGLKPAEIKMKPSPFWTPPHKIFHLQWHTTIGKAIIEPEKELHRKIGIELVEWAHLKSHGRTMNQMYRDITRVIIGNRNIATSGPDYEHPRQTMARAYYLFSKIHAATIAVCQAFKAIGIRLDLGPDWETHKRVADIPIWGIAPGMKEAWAASMPTSYSTHPSTGHLHSEKGPAIIFPKNKETGYIEKKWALHGTLFSYPVWYRIVTRRDVGIDYFMRLRSHRKRRAIILTCGAEWTLKEVCSRLAHQSKKTGNELYRIRDLGGVDISVAKYRCPSTGKAYNEFVPSAISDADEGVAWKHGLTKQQLLEGTVES